MPIEKKFVLNLTKKQIEIIDRGLQYVTYMDAYPIFASINEQIAPQLINVEKQNNKSPTDLSFNYLNE